MGRAVWRRPSESIAMTLEGIVSDFLLCRDRKWKEMTPVRPGYGKKKKIFSALLLSHHAHLCPLPGRLEDLTCWQYKIGTRHSASLSVHRHSCYPSPIFSNKSFVVFFYSVVGLIRKLRVSGAVHFLSGWDCEIGDNLHFGWFQCNFIGLVFCITICCIIITCERRDATNWFPRMLSLGFVNSRAVDGTRRTLPAMIKHTILP